MNLNNQIGGMRDEEITLENGKTITISFPESFFCPLTLSLIEDPVTASDGFTYERTAIKQVLDNPDPRFRRISPQTREILKNFLIPNKNFIQIMNELKEDAYKKQLDHEIGHLVKLASENDPQAIFELSLKYRTERETLVVRDLVKSIQLLKKSYKLEHGPSKLLCENTKYIKEKYFDKGIELYKEGKYSIAANIWQELLSLKFHDAYAYLADLLIDGRFEVPKNYDRAFQLATEGVALGSKHCLGVLGRCYVFGIGVSKDEKKGVCLAKEGAENKSFFSQYVVGMCYYEGIVLLNDFNQAKINFTLAADQEYANAQYMLAVLQNNFLMTCDPNIDYQINDNIEHYYELAANQGLDKAQLELAYFLLSENISYLDSEKYFNLAAAQGNGDAYFSLYEYCGLFNKREKKDFYFNKALEKGVLAAMEFQVQKYFLERKYKDSFKLLKLAAEKGSKKSMLIIGNYYRQGIGVDKNYSSALCWYRLALEKEEYEAYIELSKMYENGYGVDVDYEKATKYLRMACIEYKSDNEGNNYIISFNTLEELAEAGIVSAQYNLAETYLQGIGVQRNFENALSLYQKAADKNYVKAIYELSNIHEDEKYALLCLQKAVNMCYAKAQYNLAYKYLWGNDLVEKDEEKGIQLLKLSAYQGYAKAQYSLAIEYIEQDKEGKDKDIINLLRLSARHDKNYQYEVGLMYLSGHFNNFEITIDYKEAIRYFHLSAEQGYLPAQILLARIFEKDDKITQNYRDSLRYYLLISRNENYVYLILYEFARLYEEGKVFKRDYTEALRLYTASYNLYKKERNNFFVFSAAKLGVFYEKGLGCEQNYEMAVHFYNIIKDTYFNIPDAFINYAKMLEEGRGVEKNIKAANKLFYKAASCRNKEALDRYKKKAENGKLQDIYNLATLYEQNNLLNEAKSLYCQLSEKGFKRGIENKLKEIFYYNEYVNIDQLYNRVSA